MGDNENEDNQNITKDRNKRNNSRNQRGNNSGKKNNRKSGLSEKKDTSVKPPVSQKLVYDDNIEYSGKDFYDRLDVGITDKISDIYEKILLTIKDMVRDENFDSIEKKKDIDTEHNKIKKKIIDISKSLPELKLLLKRFEYSSENISFTDSIKPFSNPFILKENENNKNIQYTANIIASIMTDGSTVDIIDYFKTRLEINIESDIDDYDVISNYLPLYCFLLNQISNSSTINLKDLSNVKNLITKYSGKKKLLETLIIENKIIQEQSKKALQKQGQGKSKKGQQAKKKQNYNPQSRRYNSSGGAGDNLQKKKSGQQKQSGKPSFTKKTTSFGNSSKKDTDIYNVLKYVENDSLKIGEIRDDNNLKYYLDKKLETTISKKILEKLKQPTERKNGKTENNSLREIRYNLIKTETDKYFRKGNKERDQANIDNDSPDFNIETLIYGKNTLEDDKIKIFQINSLYIYITEFDKLRNIFSKDYFVNYLNKKLELSTKEKYFTIYVNRGENLEITATNGECNKESGKKLISELTNRGCIIFGNASGGGKIKDVIDVRKTLREGIFSKKKEDGKQFKFGNEYYYDSQKTVFEILKSKFRIEHFNRIEKLTDNELKKIRQNLIEYLIGLYSYSYTLLFKIHEDIEKELECIIELEKENKLLKREKRLELEEEQNPSSNTNTQGDDVNSSIESEEMVKKNATNVEELKNLKNLKTELIKDISTETKEEILQRKKEEYSKLLVYETEKREQLQKEIEELEK